MTGPGLVRRTVEVPAGDSLAGAAGSAGELWFVMAGVGRFGLADGETGTFDLRPDRGMWVPAGTAYWVRADEAGSGAAGAGAGAGLRLDVVCLPDGTGLGAPGVVASDLADCAAEITGDRTFRVLFGPGRGCPVATQFVGEIPPGRAPDHSHPYDELVLVLSGEGVAHVDGEVRALAAGSRLHLPPGLPHCLENTGSTTLRVLGVFHPADSPASKLPPRSAGSG